ncbi:LuxE/PaaK family acyltransferase [Hufsiella arboris]|uniref:LuxE/PaaK family acyltransferase n=1 Tax=Hufsiella arboris TaxID=2695275 RepID=UPI0034E19884
MNTITQEEIFSIKSHKEFEKLALRVFFHQYKHCKVYSDFVTNLGIKPQMIKSIGDIPFLPIEFFKNHQVVSTNNSAEVIFTSSGTTGTSQSRHLVSDVSWYIKSFRQGFKQFYGNIKDFAFLALLPSYLEREGSSLIYMIDDLIRESGHSQSGYFLYNHQELFEILQSLKNSKTPTILMGVTFALLDFIETYSIDFPELVIMETGGMKGRRKEMIREELHAILCEGFGVPSIHSEYGMTELLSQAYSLGDGIFHCPAWMKVLVRDTNDPLSILGTGATGGINVIDLANINSCSFIATQDLGKLREDGRFEVLGRFDNSDIRGCNLLVQ